MGIFGFVGSLAKAAVNTVTLPVSAAVDLVTIDGNETEENVKRLENNVKKMKKSLDDKPR